MVMTWININIRNHNKMASMKQIDGYKIYMNKMIGKGSFGAVYEGIADQTGQKVAVKVLPKSSIDADEYLKNALFSEIKIMECIKSDNVVGFFDVMESSKNYYLVQELCDGGDLSSVMKAGQTVDQAKAKDYLLQICNGFLALIREGIIHRDLKPANVMIKGNKLKIGDFGFAKKSETSSKVSNQTIVGTPLYMSLQILKSQPYSSKCDIWALGFIYYQMLHGYPPWNGKSEYDLINKIQTRPLEISEKFSAETRDFLKKTLEKTEEKRISWDQVFVHPIFNGYFMKFSKGNQEFQNKLKTIMADLRFQINSHNLDLCQILARLGYKSGQSQLDKQRFFRFLQMINPDITRSASDYIFNKTDYDRNGTISINQIQKIMNENNINLSTIGGKVPGFSKDGTESFQIMNPETEKKIKGCFAKLMRDISMNKSTLKEVFNRFDSQKKGKMSFDNFATMIKNISKDITEDEARAAFNLVDEDGSNTVEFDELNNYYAKVNGIPPILLEKNSSSDNTKMEEEPPNHNNNGNNNGGNWFGGFQQQQPQQQPQQTPFNPLGALMGQPNYGPPPMYQQPYNPYMFGQTPPPPQNQQGGMFGNYIFNQLSGNNPRGPYGGW